MTGFFRSLAAAAAPASEHEIQIVRDAEFAVDRAAWNIHCIELAAERAAADLAKHRSRAAEARDEMAAKQAALDAIRGQFPHVEPEEVDLHGVT